MMRVFGGVVPDDIADAIDEWRANGSPALVRYATVQRLEDAPIPQAQPVRGDGMRLILQLTSGNE